MREFTLLHQKRMEYQPHLPKALRMLARTSFIKKEVYVSSVESLKSLFPYTWGQKILHGQSVKHEKISSALIVGVVFSGGQAPGGHNVIAGLFDALTEIHPSSRLWGFLGGPSGIVEGKCLEITKELLFSYRNQGGFDLIGSGRTKIETLEQMQKSLKVCQDLTLDGLVIIGGDDSNTNAALLAEYFAAEKSKTCVIGVPKTIDGDLKNEHIEVSFGFDTACKIYSELIGNIARDALSAKKYYHFIRLMGRSASHITLECALATRPNLALISEEIASVNKSLSKIVEEVADLICQRSSDKKEYGVVLIPEGMIEFIPEIKTLIRELNSLLAEGSKFSKELEKLGSVADKIAKVNEELSEEGGRAFSVLPEEIQKQLLLDRDPHGNVQVSKIETERLLDWCVSKELMKRKELGIFKGKFNTVLHFLGYEGRCGMPSNFDANYCYSLGYTAAALIREKANGYMACIGRLSESSDDWEVKGIPLNAMLVMEKRQGKEKAVIKKALVELASKPFQYFQKMRGAWGLQDHFLYPGPIQFFGDKKLVDAIPQSMQF